MLLHPSEFDGTRERTGGPFSGLIRALRGGGQRAGPKRSRGDSVIRAPGMIMEVGMGLLRPSQGDAG